LGDQGATVFDDSTYDINIGYNDHDSTAFDGYIDDVRVYNRVISAAEVSGLYSGSCPGDPPKRIEVCHDRSGSYEWTVWEE